MVEQPDGRAVGPPPEDFRRAGREVRLPAEPDLDGDHAALVIDAHEQAQGRIEEYPGCEPVSRCCPRARKVDGGEEARNRWEEEASFLMGDSGEENQAGDCAEESKAWWVERLGHGWEQSQGGAEEKGERGHKVLVERVKAVRGKIGGLRIIEKRVEWCDDRRRDESREVSGRIVEAGVRYHAEKSCK